MRPNKLVCLVITRQPVNQPDKQQICSYVNIIELISIPVRGVTVILIKIGGCQYPRKWEAANYFATLTQKRGSNVVAN